MTYKENVPDTRESPAREMVNALQEYRVDVYGCDPLLSRKEIEGLRGEGARGAGWGEAGLHNTGSGS